MAEQPLAGVRIFDLSRLFPGPYASLLLADLGAEVIKIEAPLGGDYLRHYPPLASDQNSAAFHALNRGKQSVALDLKSEAGKQALEVLLGTADVVLESFRPGVMERIGFAPSAILKRHPRLIVCSISGYGQTGPDATRAGHDLNFVARSGVMGISPEPSLLPVQVADLCGGAWPAALQITAALLGRQTSGKGCTIDVSMTDGAHAMMIMPLANRALAGKSVAGGVDVLSGSVPSYQVYPTKDGHLAVAALEPQFWSRFCAAIEREDLLHQGQAMGEEGRVVRAQIAAILSARNTSEWEAVFADIDACVEPVRNPDHVLENDVQLRTRGVQVEVKLPETSISVPSTPLRMAGVRPSRQGGPGIGEQTESILRQAGVGDDVLAAVLEAL